MGYRTYIQSGVICKFTLHTGEENKKYSVCPKHGKLETDHRFCPNCGSRAEQKSFIEDEYIRILELYDLEDPSDFKITDNMLIVKFGGDEDDDYIPFNSKPVEFDNDYELYEFPDKQEILNTLHDIELYKRLCDRFTLIEKKVFFGILHSY